MMETTDLDTNELPSPSTFITNVSRRHIKATETNAPLPAEMHRNIDSQVRASVESLFAHLNQARTAQQLQDHKQTQARYQHRLTPVWIGVALLRLHIIIFAIPTLVYNISRCYIKTIGTNALLVVELVNG